MAASYATLLCEGLAGETSSAVLQATQTLLCEGLAGETSSAVLQATQILLCEGLAGETSSLPCRLHSLLSRLEEGQVPDVSELRDTISFAADQLSLRATAEER